MADQTTEEDVLVRVARAIRRHRYRGCAEWFTQRLDDALPDEDDMALARVVVAATGSDPQRQSTAVLDIRRQEERPEGPPCTCGRRGWCEVAACASYRCAGRTLARIMLEPDNAR